MADGIEPSVLGYGPQGGEVTSPGPTIRLKDGEAAKIVLHNVDISPHDFVAVARKKVDTKTLWRAYVDEEYGGEEAIGEVGTARRASRRGLVHSY